ncbi:catalase, partial [Elizabethkingia anophelis]|nr:catalase [Elizabethkingia anophelis]
NSHHLPVNACPFQVNNYQRDGYMAMGDNGGDAPNYFPNSFDNIAPDPTYKPFEEELDSAHVAFFDRNKDDNDHYTQPGLLYSKAMNDEDRKNLIHNIVEHMKGIKGEKKDLIINRQLCHFFRANIELGIKIAAGLGVTIDASQMQHSTQ